VSQLAEQDGRHVHGQLKAAGGKSSWQGCSTDAPEAEVDNVAVTLPLKKSMLNNGTMISTKVPYLSTVGLSIYIP